MNGAGLLALIACRDRLPLDEVPIDGGAAAMRAAVRAELVAFDVAAGAGRVSLRRVRLVEREVPLGMFHGRTDVVELSVALRQPELAQIVRHELCHALDDAEELTRDEHPALDAFADALYRSGGELDIPLYRGDSPADRRAEAMAELCEIGPSGAATVAVACPGDAPSASVLATWAVGHVWTGQPPPPLPSSSEVVQFVPPGSFDSFAVAETTTPGILSVTLAAEGRAWFVLADLWSGTVQSGVPQQTVEAASHPPPDGPDGALGWPHGPGAGELQVDMPPLELALRVQGSDGGPWAPVLGACLPKDPAAWQFFTASNEVWIAAASGDTLTWVRAVP